MVQAHFKKEQRQNHEERFEENKSKEPEIKMILRQKEQGRKDGMQKEGGTQNETEDEKQLQKDRNKCTASFVRCNHVHVEKDKDQKREGKKLN